MCLILFAIKPLEDLQLVVAANRDEYYARPTLAAGYWPDHPGIFAGRDQEAGGTWLGVSRAGRFAAVTNCRDPNMPLQDPTQQGQPQQDPTQLSQALSQQGQPPQDPSQQGQALPQQGQPQQDSIQQSQTLLQQNHSQQTTSQQDCDGPDNEQSRGGLPTGFLLSSETPLSYLTAITAEQYKGFNLLVFDGQSFGYLTNRPQAINSHKQMTSKIQLLEPGCYGVSNQLLDCDWPKVAEGRLSLQKQLADLQSLGSIRSDSTRANLTESLFNLLASEGDGRAYSNSFIRSDVYGTRASTVVIIHADGTIWFEERTFSNGGVPGAVVQEVILSA